MLKDRSMRYKTSQIISYYIHNDIDKAINAVNLSESLPDILIDELMILISRDHLTQKKNILLKKILSHIKNIDSHQQFFNEALSNASRLGNLPYIKTIILYFKEVSYINSNTYMILLKRALVLSAVHNHFNIVTFLGPIILKRSSRNISEIARSILTDFERNYYFESVSFRLRPIDQLKRYLVIYFFEEIHFINQGIKVLTESRVPKIPKDLFNLFQDFLV